MEKKAYLELDKLDLPRPKIIDFENLVKEIPSRNVYFLRCRHGTSLKKNITSAELKMKEDYYRKLINDQAIIQIEEGIISHFGGCATVHEGNIYTELVNGHLSGLLLHGWHFLKAYIESEKQLKKKNVQDIMIKQDISGNIVIAASKVEKKVYNTILQTVKNHLNNIGSDLLFEFIIDSNQDVFYVDIKEYPFVLNFRTLFSEENEGRLIYCENNETEKIKNDQIKYMSTYDGSFEIENLSKIEGYNAIKVKNYAILSHFVTRSLRRGIKFILT